MKFRSFITVPTEAFIDFASSTSLHGLQKIFDNSNNLNKPSIQAKLSQRKIFILKLTDWFFWGAAFSVAVVLLITLNRLVWWRKENTSTITTIDTYYYPIYEVPFPAVTICSNNVAHRQSLQPIFNMLIQDGHNESDIMKFLSNVKTLIEPKPNTFTKKGRNITVSIFKAGYTTNSAMLEAMQPCNTMIKICIWMGQLMPCDKLFFVSKTERGYCCSFNSHWDDQGEKQHEFRVFGSGRLVGLDLLLWPDGDNYVSYHKPHHGVDIILHDKDDFADSGHLFSVLPGYNVDIYLTPTVVISDKQIRSLPPKKRNCLFSDEKTLFVSKNYSYESCMVDCRVKGYIEFCDCIPFFYKHALLPEFANITLCDFSSSDCLYRYRTLIWSTEPPSGSAAFEHSKNKTINTGLKCDCLPECEEIRYAPRISLSSRYSSPNFNQPNKPIPIFGIPSRDMLNYTTVTIAFEENNCIRYRRSVYMTWDDMLASFGGVFGLCLGGSFISLVEVVYLALTRSIGTFSSQYFSHSNHRNGRQRIFFISNDYSFT